MHIVTISEPIELSSTDIIAAGTYVAEDQFGGQMIVMAGGGTMKPLDEKRHVEFRISRDKLRSSYSRDGVFGFSADVRDCSSILIGRTGGLGDLTLLTPVIREIKRRWPAVKIAVATIKELNQSIQNLPYIDELLAYPVTLEKAQQYDGWIWLENAIERNEDAKTLHSVDCIAKFIGLDLPEDCDKVQDYHPTDAERNWVKYAHPRVPGFRRLCVQVGASAKCRVYPMSKTAYVVQQLLKKGWEVFLLGAPGEIRLKDTQPGLRVVADGATFRQRAALIESSDCVLAPDSSLTHIAGALHIPCVALYGPFPWQVRTKYNPLTVALTRKEGFPCAPCFHHAHLTKEFPSNCPTKDKGICGVLDAIEPDKIVAEIERIALTETEKVVAFEPK